MKHVNANNNVDDKFDNRNNSISTIDTSINNMDDTTSNNNNNNNNSSSDSSNSSINIHSNSKTNKYNNNNNNNNLDVREEDGHVVEDLRGHHIIE